MTKKIKRIGRVMITVVLPLIVLFTLINMYLLTHFQRSSGDTTFVLNERVYNKNSESSSKTGKRFDNTKEKPIKTAENIREDVEAVRQSDDVGDKSPGGTTVKSLKDTLAMHDETIDNMMEKLNKSERFFPKYLWSISLHNLTRKLGGMVRKTAKTLSGYSGIKTYSKQLPAWKLVHRNVRQFSLYDPDDPNLKTMLHEMATQPIIEAEENDGGTQLKVNIRFSNDGRAVLKPMRYARDKEANENHYIFDDIERHIAEIAAYQLDNLLGFYRVPPTIGRWINITSQLKDLVPEPIKKTFFYSPARNVCFFGSCDYYCDSAHAFCGNPHMMEFSVQSYLPSRNIATRKSWYQPWRRSYSKFRKAHWETHYDMCTSIRKEAPFNNGKLLLDMIDAHTFDFLTGNKDRHSFATFTEFGNYSFPIMYDNGRGFGRQTYDAMSILAPLNQCCVIRKSTFLKYIKLYIGPDRLSFLMEKALATDLVAPVLIPAHLNALDRRLIKILQAVAVCLEKNRVEKVIISDRF